MYLISLRIKKTKPNKMIKNLVSKTLPVALLMSASTLSAQQAKYVFYFIGDGMGQNHVYATNLFLKQQDKKALLFPTFPARGVSSTYSTSNQITDSAAAGTALATGRKTSNGTIGMDSNRKVKLESVADEAKAYGSAVGIISSVSLDHATPAAFYAHQPSRSMAYEIASEIPASGFDFFAGSGFAKPTDKSPSVYDKVANAGYQVVRGVEAFEALNENTGKLILIQEDGVNPNSLLNAIDQKEGDLTLPYMTEMAIENLTDASDKGFFMMVEGGIIDWAGHGNDAATMVTEVIDFDNAIKKAYDFYLAKPDSTLIIVTADHETGGLGLGTKGYELSLNLLANQKKSQSELSNDIYELREKAKKGGKTVSWSAIKALLKKEMGFWGDVKISSEQEDRLKEMYNKMVSGKDYKSYKSLYSTSEPLAKLAIDILSENANVGWTTGSHTASEVPVYAIGVGSEKFNGSMDNTDIPRRISRIAGY